MVYRSKYIKKGLVNRALVYNQKKKFPKCLIALGKPLSILKLKKIVNEWVNILKSFENRLINCKENLYTFFL